VKGIIKIFDTERFKKQFTKSEPFSYVVIDDFFDPVLLKSVSESFPEYDDEKWFRFRKNIGEYENIFESKIYNFLKDINYKKIWSSKSSFNHIFLK